MATLRNTPTCVGKTQKYMRCPTFREKHPHVRGEDLRPLVSYCWLAETPPRAWGRHRKGQTTKYGRGNTPTCVGKTIRNSCGTTTRQKHPHVRGEDGGLVAAGDVGKETPPRAWGRPCGVTLTMHLIRNTPTCVGKTAYTPQSMRVAKKHPHVRGEDFLLSTT